MLLLPLSSVAETYYFKGPVNDGTVLTTATAWTNSEGLSGSTISAGNTYIANNAVTTPTVNFTFAGDTLQLVPPAGRLRMAINSATTLTFQDLIFNGGKDLYYMGSGSPITLAGKLTLLTDCVFTTYAPTSGRNNWGKTQADMVGTNITVTCLGNTGSEGPNAIKKFGFFGNNSALSNCTWVTKAGSAALALHPKIQWVSETQLGVPPATFDAAAITLMGAQIWATNDTAFISDKRGITLASPGATHTLQGGGFHVENNATVTCAYPITGTGPFVKTGNGTCILTASSLSYTGETQLKEGALVIADTSSLASDILVIEDGYLSFSTNQCTIVSVLFKSGGFKIPLNSRTNVSDVACLRVTDTFTVPSFTNYYPIRISVVTNGLDGSVTRFKLMDLPLDPALQDFHFIVEDNPWLGTLSVETSGGRQSVWFDWIKPENLVFKTAADEINGDYSFMDAEGWSDGLTPRQGKTYVSQKTLVPPENEDVTFPGDGLHISNLNMSFEKTTTPTLTNCTVFNSSFQLLSRQTPGIRGDILVLPDAAPGAPSLRVTSGGTWQWEEFHMDASLRGFGNLRFEFYANHHEDSQYLLYGDNSRF